MLNRTEPLVARYPVEPDGPSVPAGPTVAIGGPLDFGTEAVGARGEGVWVALEPQPAARPAAQVMTVNSARGMCRL